MATTTTTATVEEDAAVDLPLTIGIAHLALAGLINLATGVGVLWLAAGGTLAALWIGVLPAYVDPTSLLASSGLAVTLLDVFVPLLAAALLPLALLQVLAADSAADGRHWTLCVVAGFGGVLNPLAAPVSLISLAMLALARDGFARP